MVTHLHILRFLEIDSVLHIGLMRFAHDTSFLTERAASCTYSLRLHANVQHMQHNRMFLHGLAKQAAWISAAASASAGKAPCSVCCRSMHARRPDQQVSCSVSRNLQSQQQQDSSSKTCAGSAAARQQQLCRVSLSSGYKLSVDLEHRSCYVSGSNLSFFLNFH